MKKLIVLVLTVVMASSALAVVDPDDNMLGMYFDTTADTWYMGGITPFAITNVYAILTNPTFDELFGFEFEVSFDGSTSPYTLISSVFDNPEALNVGLAPNFIVGFGSPSVTSEATVLVTMQVMYMDADAIGDVVLGMGPSNPSSNELGLPSMLLADGVIIPVGYSTGPAAGRDAQSNFWLFGANSPTIPPDQLDDPADFGVVASEPMTFDSVKSLYR